MRYKEGGERREGRGQRLKRRAEREGRGDAKYEATSNNARKMCVNQDTRVDCLSISKERSKKRGGRESKTVEEIERKKESRKEVDEQ